MSDINYNDIYKKHNEDEKEILEDGIYLSNHIFHEVGSRERKIEIKNGSVLTENHSFSQFSFFEVNLIVRKIK